MEKLVNALMRIVHVTLHLSPTSFAHPELGRMGSRDFDSIVPFLECQI